MRGLLLGDGLGAVKVVFHGNDGEGCRENGWVRVGEARNEHKLDALARDKSGRTGW